MIETEMEKNDNILDRAELKKAPLSVPEGYFEGLPQRVAARIAAEKPQRRSTPLHRWWMAAAAACVAAVVMLDIHLTPSAADTTAAAEEDEELIIEYLAYNGLSGAYLYEELAEAE